MSVSYPPSCHSISFEKLFTVTTLSLNSSIEPILKLVTPSYISFSYGSSDRIIILFSLASFPSTINSSSGIIAPVGLDGEFIIITFVFHL